MATYSEESSRSEHEPPEVPIPGGASSMWRLIKLGYRYERKLMFASISIQLLAALPRPLTALWLLILTHGVTVSDQVLVFVALGGMSASACLGWLLSLAGERLGRQFRERLTIALEGHIAMLQSSIGSIEHQESPEYLDRLAVLRQKVFVLDHLYSSLVITATWVFQLCVLLILLIGVSPVLPVLVLFAAPLIVTATVLPAIDNRVEERVAGKRRLAEHFFDLATTSGAAKDVRLSRIRQQIVEGHTAAWSGWYAPMRQRLVASAGWNAAAWAVFGIGYGLALFFVARVINAPASAIVLVLVAGVQMSDYVSAAVGEVGFIRGVFLIGARRLAWLEDYAAASNSDGSRPAPDRIETGIALEGVSFRYRGATSDVLENIDLQIPLGSVVAIVGENGAGKSTLVKLLAKFYSPTSGRILLDGITLESIDTSSWRTKLAGSFQDFARFEFEARLSVGVGDVGAADDEDHIRSALTRGGGEGVVAELPEGLNTQLGARWPKGVEPSFGQWQRIAVSRGFMRETALLVLLDEPTAALDAESENGLFERFAEAAARHTGGITLLVSHRFSTVRMADLIVVLDGKRVVEQGDHDALMHLGGLYSELYRTQQRGYHPGR